MTMSDLLLKGLEILSPLILALLGWMGLKASLLINAKVKNEYLRGALVRLNEAVFTAVKELQQTTVDEIKRLSADGRLSPEDKLELRARAVAAIRSHIGAKGLNELASVLGLADGALDRFIEAKIESTVHDLRRTEAPPAVPSPPSLAPAT